MESSTLIPKQKKSNTRKEIPKKPDTSKRLKRRPKNLPGKDNYVSPVRLEDGRIIVFGDKEKVAGDYELKVEFFDTVIGVREVIKKATDNFEEYFNYLDGNEQDHYFGLVVLSKKMSQLLDNLEEKKDKMYLDFKSLYASYEEKYDLKYELSKLNNYINELAVFMLKITSDNNESHVSLSPSSDKSLVDVLKDRYYGNDTTNLDRSLPSLTELDALIKDLRNTSETYLHYLDRNSEYIEELREKNYKDLKNISKELDE